MGILQRLFGRKENQRSLENPAIPFTGATLAAHLQNSAGMATSGLWVTDTSELTYSPIWSGLWMISDDVAKLPLNTYRTLSDGDRERARDHPVYPVLRRHTGLQTSFDFLSSMVVNACFYGNAVALILWNAPRTQLTLRFYARKHWDLDDNYSDRDTKIYRLTDPDGVQRLYPEADILHLRGLMIDGCEGLSLADYARNTIGRALAAEQYGDQFYSNGILPQGWFMHPGGDRELSDDGVRRLMNLIEERHQQRKPFGVLREGMTFERTGVSPADAVLMDALKLGVKDVARFLKIPPHKLGDDVKTSYNSIEQENRAYLDSTLLPWMTKIEFEFNYKLFTSRERNRYFCEFQTGAFLRPTIKERFEAYAVAIQWGFMDANQVRMVENWNKYTGEEEGYDAPLTPLNMQRGLEPVEPEQPMEPPPEGDEESRAVIARDLVANEMQRHCKRILFAATSKSKQKGATSKTIESWTREHFAKLNGDLLREFSPSARLVSSLAGRPAEKIAKELCGAVADQTQRRINEAIDGCEGPEMADRITAQVETIFRDCSDYASDIVLGE